MSILSAKFHQATIADPGVLRAIVGGAVFLAVIRAGFAVFCGYAVISLVLGGILLTRRDA